MPSASSGQHATLTFVVINGGHRKDCGSEKVDYYVATLTIRKTHDL